MVNPIYPIGSAFCVNVHRTSIHIVIILMVASPAKDFVTDF